VKTLSARQGPFSQRPYYKASELERICSDALRSVALLPNTPEAVRIDRFVEKYFRLTVGYQRLPDRVLGFTRFGPSGVTEIVVTSAFDDTDNNVAERRLRTTLAHEAGHGLLHAHLFALGERPPGLFSGEPGSKPEIMCRDVEGLSARRPGYDGKWWEYQANRAIGALLMPRRLAIIAAEAFCVESGVLGLPVLMEDRREQATRTLAEVFDVNPVVARLRLAEIFPEQTASQLVL
jgi:hypothetical protein